MDTIINTGRSVFLTLLVSQLIILLLRFRVCKNKREFILFLLVLVFIGIKTFFSHVYVIGVSASLLLVFVTGNFIFTLRGARFHYLWNISIGLHTLIMLFLMVINLTETIYFSLYYLFIIAILFYHPLVLLWKLYSRSRAGVLLYLMICSVLLICARSFDFFCYVLHIRSIDATLWISIALIGGVGYMLFHEGYLIKEGLYGYHLKLDRKQKQLNKVLSRFVHTEHSLVLQDRFIAAALLAAGTTHEFKNMLTNLKTLSEYGLLKPDVENKDEIFRTILDMVHHGCDMVSRFMNIITFQHGEEKQPVDLKNDLFHFFNLVKVTYRREIIFFEFIIGDDCVILTGKGEIEHVIFNLIRNAVEAVREIEESEKRVSLTARRIEDYIMIEVRDNGRGIPEELGNKIFEPHLSSRGSSGLGLYIARMFVQKNRGSIDYYPIEKGACFRVFFPAA